MGLPESRNYVNSIQRSEFLFCILDIYQPSARLQGFFDLFYAVFARRIEDSGGVCPLKNCGRHSGNRLLARFQGRRGVAAIDRLMQEGIASADNAILWEFGYAQF